MKRLILIAVLFATSLAFGQGQHGIKLSWTLSTTSGVTSQVVCRSTTSGSENCATPLTTISDDVTVSFLDQTGMAGVKYYYVLEACIGTNCSVPSAEASAIYPPSPQTGVVAVPQ